MLDQGFFVHSFDPNDETNSGLATLLGQKAHGHYILTNAQFENFNWIKCDLVNASFSLFFCAPDRFNDSWTIMSTSLNEGGIFCGQILGEYDSWSERTKVTTVKKPELNALFSSFELLYFKEDIKETPEKYWHIYHIVARKL